MQLVVGLGNPGEKYQKTRHNVGFMMVESLVTSGWKKSKSGLLEYSWIGSEIELIKPQTFMNRSGEAVGYAQKKHSTSADQIYVIHDDLDILFGEYKIQQGKGPKGHKGVNSVAKSLGTENFWRVRVGVESREGESKKIPGEAFVLQSFSKEELLVLEEVVGKIKEELLNSLRK